MNDKGPSAPGSRGNGTPPTALARQKILIVDDKRENLVALRQVLRDAGAEIVEATSGNQALAATLDDHFAVAILDVMMPGMSGYELAEHLRGDEKTQVIPIIFVTASYADEHYMFKGYEAGGIDFIFKPVASEVLLSKVRVFLELDRHRQELRRHRDHLEALVAERTAMLTERVKEVRCLYTVSSLVAGPCESIDETLRAAVVLIPPGWQYPEIARARITFEGREFAGADFRETAWKQSADIVISGETVGTVEVFYLKEMPEQDQGPFFEEERDLIDDIARQLGVLIQRERAKERERHLNVVLRSIRNVNQLIVHEKRRDRLLQAACDNLIRSRGFHGAWIALIDKLPERLEAAQKGFRKKAFSEFVDLFRKGEMPACCRRSVGGAGVIVTGDPAAACKGCPLADAHSGNGALTVELRHGECLYGYLAVYVPLQFISNAEEVSLLEEITNDIAFALHGIETQEERRKSERIMSAVFESASDGILLADAETHKFVAANQAVCRMLGYTAEEFLGLSVADIHPPEDLPSVIEAIEKQLRGEISMAPDIPVKRKDGGVFPADINSAMLELGGRPHLLGIFRDISEHKRAEAALVKQSEILEKKAEELTTLTRKLRAANDEISNQLRAPLWRIDGICEWLLKKGGENLGPEIMRQLKNLVRHSRQATEKINRIVKDTQIDGRNTPPSS